MASKIYLVRHAEAAHNVSKDFNHRDPPLTTLGVSQAAQLADTFPQPASIGIIVTSPLKRTIQTTLAAFRRVLDERYFGDSGDGVKSGAELILDPELQERSALPCDTGSEPAILHDEFPQLDFGGLGGEWLVKEGDFAADDESVKKRAGRVAARLAGLADKLAADGGSRKDIVVVTHGVFMKFLSQDQSIDLPKAGWKTFKVSKTGDGHWELIPTKIPSQGEDERQGYVYLGKN